jgi:hypothetical protein
MPDTLTLLSFLFLLAAGVVVTFRFLRVRAESIVPKRVFQTPVFVHLVPSETEAWKDHRKVKDITAEITAREFSKLGEYQIFEMPDVTLAAFFNVPRRVLAVLYEHPAVGVWVDVGSEYESGESLTVSSAPSGGELDHMPGQEKVFLQGASVAELLEKVLEMRKPDPCKVLTAESFPQVFQDRYAEEMRWRALRGGTAAGEILRVAEASGMKVTEGDIEAARASLEAARILPCQKTGECPYDRKKDPERTSEQMPVVENDPRTCPTHGRICPGFLEEFAQSSSSGCAPLHSAS